MTPKNKGDIKMTLKSEIQMLCNRMDEICKSGDIKMTAKEIKRLALLKWVWVRNNWSSELSYRENMDKLRAAVPEIEHLSYGCSYCEIYSINCTSCPLHDVGFLCCREYQAWRNNLCVATAQAMIDKITNQETL